MIHGRMEKQKKESLPFIIHHGGDVMSLGWSSDLFRLRYEIKALGGVLDALSLAVGATRESPIPDEHLVSYV